MKHFIVTFKPDDRQVSIHVGATLLEAAGQAGIILNTVCGGKGTCKKCTLALEPTGEQVLACQYHIRKNLTVTIPQSSRLFEQKILSAGIDTKTELQPDIYKKYSRPDPASKILGLAIDLGTTTVVAKLIDMTNGRCLATCADLNPQIQYGDDVISRIHYAQTNTELTELHNKIIYCIAKLITRLCSQSSIEPKYIYEACVVGNTTMNHIFLKFPITQLGQAPYRAFSVDSTDTPADKLSLPINPTGNIHTVENIAGFVGSDTTAVALATDIASADEMTLIVDIGTNGEIVLGSSDKLYAASCAAGPALEGARISCGSRAAEGAIETVVVNENDIDFDVIGGTDPHSICGSGLIDAAAVLLNLGIIDSTGRFAEPQKLAGLPPAILSRIIKHKNQPAFVLAKQLLLTQQDIRQLQLAKSAIRTGTKLLQKKMGIADSDIKHIFLAGAFGNYIRRKNAVRIGLLPDIPHERIRFVGNAACSGAQMILLSTQAREQAKNLARRIEYVEIAHEKEFSNVFADEMLF